jgi:predicted  nucleic acid-binding Zn-ribbon protein
VTVIKQLYQLQEIDNQIESEEQTLSQKVGQLGDRRELDAAWNQLNSEQERWEELKRHQHEAEWEIDDVLSKISAAEQQLYGGKITNPKELSSLQHEASLLKAKSDQMQNKALEIIDQVEEAEKSVTATSNAFRELEDEWQRQQQALSLEIEQLKSQLEDLRQRRQEITAEIESPAVKLYENIRKQKRNPVARVEQGICRSCRISLSAAELQRARGGNLIQCGSCGRILFLP